MITKEMSTDRKASGSLRLSSQEHEEDPVKETEKESPRGKKKPKKEMSWKPNEIFNDEFCKMKVR